MVQIINHDHLKPHGDAVADWFFPSAAIWHHLARQDFLGAPLNFALQDLHCSLLGSDFAWHASPEVSGEEDMIGLPVSGGVLPADKQPGTNNVTVKIEKKCNIFL